MSAEHRVQRLSLPASLEAPDAAAFLEFCGLADEVQRQIWGHEDRCSPAAYRLRAWRDSAYESTAFFYVRDGDRMVGRAWCRVPLQEDLGRAQVRAEVLASHAGRGIGRLLLDAAVEEARRRGRTVLDMYTEHPIATLPTLPLDPAAAGGPDGAAQDAGVPGAGGPDAAEPRDGSPSAVVPSTGTGAVPGGDRSVRFAQAAGFALSQVTRFSELVLDEHEAGWPALEAAAKAKAEPYYEVLLWEGVPPEHRAAMAELFGRMSIDAPQGADTYEPELWDADRVAALDRMLAEAGTVPLYAVARHRGSGEFAAYTALWVREGKEEVGDQDDTLVRIGHRGHSLGMLIKLANLRAYRRRFPHAAKVLTFNAAENEHMLAINTALGFRPAGADGEWYRRLA